MGDTFMDFVRAVVTADQDDISRRLTAHPGLAVTSAEIGATRVHAGEYFFDAINHYLYEGDTALHMAAAAFRCPIVELLIAAGADCAARNRRGAQPLHYAADANHWRPEAQAETIACLMQAGADPNGVDNSGVAPLHRAVRTRSAPAVKALLDGGANPRLQNGSGSTPLDLARLTTGRGGSGSPLDLEQQAAILKLLDSR